MGTRVHIEHDTLGGDAKPPRVLRELYVEDDDNGQQTIVVRPYSGSVEIRTNGNSVTIDAFAVPALLRVIRDAAKEAG